MNEMLCMDCVEWILEKKNINRKYVKKNICEQ